MAEIINNQSVPVTELEDLVNTLDKIKCITVRERNILWTCQEGLLGLIEDYKGDKKK